MIEQGIIQYLFANSDLSSFYQGLGVAQPRVQGVMLPAKDNKIPATVFSSVSSHEHESLRGPNLLETRRFQFDNYGRTFLESRILSRLVRRAWCPPDSGGNPTSLRTVLPDGSAVGSTRIMMDIDKPFESGEGSYIFCATLDVEISFVNQSS